MGVLHPQQQLETAFLQLPADRRLTALSIRQKHPQRDEISKVQLGEYGAALAPHDRNVLAPPNQEDALTAVSFLELGLTKPAPSDFILLGAMAILTIMFSTF